MPLKVAGRTAPVLARDQPRAALAAVLEGPRGPFTAVALHLSFVPGWNIRQLLAVRRWIADLPRPPAAAGRLQPDRRAAPGRPQHAGTAGLAGSGRAGDVPLAPPARPARPHPGGGARRGRHGEGTHTAYGDLGPPAAGGGTVAVSRLSSTGDRSRRARTCPACRRCRSG
ncbi:endonuclease/exonuclease/phosphatase family protein [Streptomyces sp. L7]